MKTSVHSSSSEQGSVLVVTLFIALLFGVFLFSYFNIVRQQQRMVSRSQAWNAAMAMAEAGAEEALAQLNPGTPLPAVIDRTANGWGNPTAQGIYGPVTRSFTNASYSTCFTTNRWPIIYSTGTVVVASIPATLTRVIRVGTTNVPLFNVAMGAKSGVNFNGNNVNTDSYDSNDTNAWTSTTPQGTNGSVATIGGVVNVGNANVHGEVYLGPTADSSIKNNGVITGGVANDFNADFPSVVMPTGSSSWLPAVAVPTVVDGVSYAYSFATSGDYQINSSFSGSIYIAPGANVRLRINASASPNLVRVGGVGYTAGKLTLYLNGPSFSLSGQSIVDGGVANNLAYLGTSLNTSISISGNAEFVGTMYAPDADISLNGGGGNNIDFVGSLIGKSISVSGHFNFHYDEALMRSGPARAYVAKSWGEI